MIELKEHTKISVIMGSYNPKKEYLQRAVCSIICQTFYDWELIIYDDGSEDEQRNIIDEIAAMDRRILVIHGDYNRGLAYGLNRCLEIAKGNYIARMDDDDISKENRLEKQYDFLQSHPEFQWVSSNCYMFDDNSVWGIDRYPEEPGNEDFLAHSAYVHPATMFRKTILNETSGYQVSSDTMRCEDYELFMRLHAAGYRGYNFQDPLFYYREDENGVQKRKYRYRYREMLVRQRCFRELKILRLTTFPYVVKPLIVGMIPIKLLRKIRRLMKKDRNYEREDDTKI